MPVENQTGPLAKLCEEVFLEGKPLSSFGFPLHIFEKYYTSAHRERHTLSDDPATAHHLVAIVEDRGLARRNRPLRLIEDRAHAVLAGQR